MPKINDTKNIDNDILSKINLIAPKNYVGDFDSIKTDLIDIKRWIMPNDFILTQLKNVNDKTMADFLNNIKSPVNDNETQNLLTKIKDFFEKNPLLTIAIKDKHKNFQIAVIIWHKLTNDLTGIIKNTKNNKSLHRFILTNDNLDKSYGVQAENPRIKITSAINSVLNYQMFNSYDNQKTLLNNKLTFINDLIDSENNKFNGFAIINRGYYDNPDYFGKKSNDNETKSNDNDFNTDNFMDL